MMTISISSDDLMNVWPTTSKDTSLNYPVTVPAPVPVHEDTATPAEDTQGGLEVQPNHPKKLNKQNNSGKIKTRDTIVDYYCNLQKMNEEKHVMDKEKHVMDKEKHVMDKENHKINIKCHKLEMAYWRKKTENETTQVQLQVFNQLQDMQTEETVSYQE